MLLNPCDPRHFIHPPPLNAGFCLVKCSPYQCIFIVSTFWCISVWFRDMTALMIKIDYSAMLLLFRLLWSGDSKGQGLGFFMYICVLPSPPQLKVLIHLIRRCSLQRCLMSDIFRHPMSQTLVWVRVPSWTGSDNSDSGLISSFHCCVHF